MGINPARMRFRQHLQHEMAHYAEDCWDAEVETSYGWVECAGLADRSAYDLKAHTTMSKIELTAYERYDQPKVGAGCRGAAAVQTCCERGELLYRPALRGVLL